MGRKVRHILDNEKGKPLCKRIITIYSWMYSCPLKEIPEYIEWMEKNKEIAAPLCKKCEKKYLRN